MAHTRNSAKLPPLPARSSVWRKAVVLGRVGDAGGEVLLPKTAIGENAGGGFVGWVRDPEGNRVGFYSAA